MSEFRPALSTAGAGVPQEPVRGGVWYYVVTVATVGTFVAAPFWHAAGRLGRPEVRRLAIAYTVAGVYLVVLAVLNPRRPDGTYASEALNGLLGASALIVIIAGCVQLRGLRRRVYGGGGVVPVQRDPAVARALEGSGRREEARQLIARDPGIRRELGVGRPDLGRGYDDGGLIDLNTAPATLIAQVCGIDRSHAEAIVAGREARGGTFFNIGEVLVEGPLPPHVQDQLRERAIF
ncbi:helix-hairpin-helix domain-containing protein [Blastococcus sp. SYSU D01042]